MLPAVTASAPSPGYTSEGFSGAASLSVRCLGAKDGQRTNLYHVTWTPDALPSLMACVSLVALPICLYENQDARNEKGRNLTQEQYIIQWGKTKQTRVPRPRRTRRSSPGTLMPPPPTRERRPSRRHLPHPRRDPGSSTTTRMGKLTGEREGLVWPGCS